MNTINIYEIISFTRYQILTLVIDSYPFTEFDEHLNSINEKIKSLYGSGVKIIITGAVINDCCSNSILYGINREYPPTVTIKPCFIPEHVMESTLFRALEASNMITFSETRFLRYVKDYYKPHYKNKMTYINDPCDIIL